MQHWRKRRKKRRLDKRADPRLVAAWQYMIRTLGSATGDMNAFAKSVQQAATGCRELQTAIEAMRKLGELKNTDGHGTG